MSFDPNTLFAKMAKAIGDDAILRAKNWRDSRDKFGLPYEHPASAEIERRLGEMDPLTDENADLYRRLLSRYITLNKWILPLGGDPNDQFYTPSEYIEAARRVMGRIDCDPASNELANKVVKAAVFYDINNSGLGKKPWKGNVWMNPPYSIASKFIFKLVKEHWAGRTKQAVVLWIGTSRGSKAWKALDAVASTKCWTKNKIMFERPDGDREGIRDQNVFFYIGKNVQGFRKEFKEWGDIT